MLNNKTVYVLHQTGAPSHYNALVELGRQNGFEVEFRVFSPRAILGLLRRLRLKEALSSLFFLLSLPRRQKTKIVLGIAPFDSYLPLLRKLLKKHDVYYHTSYTRWDGTYPAYPTDSAKLLDSWKDFVSNQAKHVFAVSGRTKNELISNDYSLPEHISIVNHSFTAQIESVPHKKDNTFIFAGRLIPCKGIKELLDIFENRPDATLTISGSGELEPLVKTYSERCPNIRFEGFVKGLDKLVPIYQRHSFLIMNSVRLENWEELFGIAIIEGMACGCVPLTTDHPGPKEIITDGENGFTTEEGKISSLIDAAIAMDNSTYQSMRRKAIETSQKYSAHNMAERWSKILD
jgi:Glycosyltransferase